MAKRTQKMSFGSMIMVTVVSFSFVLSSALLAMSDHAMACFYGDETAQVTLPERSAPFGKIMITDNQGLIDFPNKTGAGTPESPYIIEDLEINCGGTSTGIYIMNTNLSLIISNCTVWNGGSGTIDAGIRIDFSSAITIENTTTKQNRVGILLYFTREIKLLDNNIIQNTVDGLYIEHVNDSFVARNKFEDNSGNGISIDDTSHNNSFVINSFLNNGGSHVSYSGVDVNNHFDMDNYGNYWDDYSSRYPTAMNNGISWSLPYVIDASSGLADNFPIVDVNNFSGPIRFYSNDDIVKYPRKTGAGTQNDPYIISNVIILSYGLYYGVFVSATSLHLEFSRCKIIGSMSDVACGFGIENAYNIVIDDCQVISNHEGISINLGKNITIRGNLLQDNGLYGLKAYYSDAINVSSNQIDGNQADGVLFEHVSNSTFFKNAVKQNGNHGIKVTSDSINVSIEQNNFTMNLGTGVNIIQSYNMSVNQNVIQEDDASGIVISTSFNTTIYGNNIIARDASIKLVDSAYALIENNDLYQGGLTIEGDIAGAVSHQILTSNEVNEKKIYYLANMQNFTFNGDPNPGQLILINCSVGQVADFTIEDVSVGIILYHTQSLNVTRVTLNNTYHAGIDALETSHMTYANCTVISSEYGIKEESGLNNTFIQNNFSRVLESVKLMNDINISLHQNTFYKGNIAMNFMYSENCTLTSNVMWETGVVVEGGASPSIDTTNLVNGYPIYSIKNQVGFRLDNVTHAGQVFFDNCSNSVIKNVKILKTTVGIGFDLSHNNSIENVEIGNCFKGAIIFCRSKQNNITNTYIHDANIGISFYIGCNNNTISTCTLANNTTGFLGCYNSKGTILFNNTIVSNDIGINLTLGSLGPRLMYNNVSFNTGTGVMLGDVDQGLIVGNNISFNQGYGMVVSTSSTYNSIYLNSFIGNLIAEAYVQHVSNTWNSTTIGNFWGDYENRYPSASHSPFTWDLPYQVNGTVNVLDYHPMYYNSVPTSDFQTNSTTILISWEIMFTFSGDRGDYPSVITWNVGANVYTTTYSRMLLTFHDEGNMSVTCTVTDRNGDTSQKSTLIRVLNATKDNDGDGLSNGDEMIVYRTDPLLEDTDGDQMPDGWEIQFDFNPLDVSDASVDHDIDGLSNVLEYLYKTDPTNPDTDGDGYLDGDEISWGSDPLNSYNNPSTISFTIVAIIAVPVTVVIALIIRAKKQKQAPQDQSQATITHHHGQEDVVRGEQNSLALGRRIQEKRAILERAVAPGDVERENEDIGKKKKLKEKESKDEDQARTIDKKTEKELKVEVTVEKCLVCNKALAATSYVCPVCKTQYCIRCAISLSQRDEPCWTCKTPFSFDVR